MTNAEYRQWLLVLHRPYCSERRCGVMGEWISVKDRLPEVSIEVLGYAEKEDRFFVVAYSDTYRCFFSGQFANDDITHWMPLPRTPQKEG